MKNAVGLALDFLDCKETMPPLSAPFLDDAFSSIKNSIFELPLDEDIILILGFGDDLFPDCGLWLSLVLGYPPIVIPAPVFPD